MAEITDANGYYLPSKLTDAMLLVYICRVYGNDTPVDAGTLLTARHDYLRIYASQFTVPAAKNELDKLTALFIALRFRKAAS